ncbi:hypothetical protein, partial [Falsiroseomonas oryzae]|uniref:hypothetical protein n=1 Tax=Falsiroseomonas oryzae TaxID=2766473 RepID=UPI0022EA934D
APDQVPPGRAVAEAAPTAPEDRPGKAADMADHVPPGRAVAELAAVLDSLADLIAALPSSDGERDTPPGLLRRGAEPDAAAPTTVAMDDVATPDLAGFLAATLSLQADPLA